MEARGTKTIFMPPARRSALSSTWRSSAALRPPPLRLILKRDPSTATNAATCHTAGYLLETRYLLFHYVKN